MIIIVVFFYYTYTVSCIHLITEIILIGRFAAQDAFIIIINV